VNSITLQSQPRSLYHRNYIPVARAGNDINRGFAIGSSLVRSNVIESTSTGDAEHDSPGTKSRDGLELAIMATPVKARLSNVSDLTSTSSRSSTMVENQTMASSSVPIESGALQLAAISTAPSSGALHSYNTPCSEAAIRTSPAPLFVDTFHTNATENSVSSLILSELHDGGVSSDAALSGDVLSLLSGMKMCATDVQQVMADAALATRFSGALREIRQASQREIADLCLRHENEKTVLAKNAQHELQASEARLRAQMEQLHNQTAAAVADIKALHDSEREDDRASASNSASAAAVNLDAELAAQKQRLDFEHGELVSHITARAGAEADALKRSIALYEIQLENAKTASSKNLARVRWGV